MDPISEGSFVLQNLVIWGGAVSSYYFGITIRKYGFSNLDTPPILKQFLVAIPICILVVAPFVAALQGATSANLAAFLVTSAVIMEHGMFLNEKVAGLIQSGRPSSAADTGG